MEVYEALKIAVLALREEELMSHEDFRLTASKVNDEWVFSFFFLPEAFGKDVTAIVDSNGKARTLMGF